MRYLSSDAGAQMSSIPAEQVYIPCHGIDCETFAISQHEGNLSVIAGHFGARDIMAAGIKNYDCLFNVREPVDRSISCLLFFYGESFRDAHRWGAEEFKHRVMTEAVKGAKCYNDAANLLVTLPRLEEQIFSNSSSSERSSDLLDSALASLRRCVIVDLFDITQEDWGAQAPEFLAAWFPWLQKKEEKTVNVKQLNNLSHKYQRMPHRLIQVLEEMNDLDMAIYEEALRLMRLQKEALQDSIVDMTDKN